MRITVTLSELEKGSVIIGGAKDRQLTILSEGGRREPFAIIPITDREGKIISAIATTGAEMRPSGVELMFRPIWSRVFITCAAKKDTVTAFVCEFEFGKYWIDVNGIRKASLTTSGNGTDPKIVKAAELEMGKILESIDSRDIITSHLTDLIKRSF